MTRTRRDAWRTAAAIVIGLSATMGCSGPTVKIEAPDKPIVINLNIKIDHELRVKVDEDIDELFDENDELFGTEVEDGAEGGGA